MAQGKVKNSAMSLRSDNEPSSMEECLKSDATSDCVPTVSGKESSGSSCEDDTELHALQEEQQRCARLLAKRNLKKKRREAKEQIRREIRELRSELDKPSITPVPTNLNGVVRGSDSTLKS